MYQILQDMLLLQEITLGAKFTFVGTTGYLPAQTEATIPGAHGVWYNNTTWDAIPPRNWQLHMAVHSTPMFLRAEYRLYRAWHRWLYEIANSITKNAGSL